MELMREIRSYPVERGSAAIWWFGQNGFIFKSAEGVVLATDMYLTDSCVGLVPGLDLSRRVPVLIEPEDLDVDVYACTHNHQDHTDPETLRRLRHKDTAQFVGPAPSCGVFAAEGIEKARIVPAWPDCSIEHGDVTIRGTFALPTDATDLNHMGFVFDFAHGPRVYVTGDTDYSELLASSAKHTPHIVITCINGGFNNLSHFEAATLCGEINPKIAIPCHYDMFPDNSADPEQFRASLSMKAPQVRYERLEHGRRFVFSV
jgi:L-ascorbate 6-phosphate lactonase